MANLPAILHPLLLFSAKKNNQFHQLIQTYADVMQDLQSVSTQMKHNVSHVIETTGQPEFAHVRKLPQTKLRAAKDEFDRMIAIGICRPSKSAWSSPYIDDVLIASSSPKEHISHLKIVFDLLRQHLAVNGEKCHFAQEEVKFLGHITSNKNI